MIPETKPLLMLLSESIARDIMAGGSFRGVKATRIQFKGGAYPENEISMGGLCEAALASVIYESLRNRLTAPER